MIEVKFLARLKEEIGQDSMEIAARDGMTIADIKQQFFSDAQFQLPILQALNHEFCDETTAVSDGDIVAFFPPVTGG
ncbi:MAG: MoaD/ThiS family protein [Gammaproteobacteria bacterium]|nr:MoaD/ThiS family protein [Gammaproteobacteria bacterium]